MGPGIALIVVGAIFALAVTADVPGLDIKMLGTILVLTGGIVLAHHLWRDRERDRRRARQDLQARLPDPGRPTGHEADDAWVQRRGLPRGRDVS